MTTNRSLDCLAAFGTCGAASIGELVDKLYAKGQPRTPRFIKAAEASVTKLISRLRILGRELAPEMEWFPQPAPGVWVLEPEQRALLEAAVVERARRSRVLSGRTRARVAQAEAVQ